MAGSKWRAHPVAVGICALAAVLLIAALSAGSWLLGLLGVAAGAVAMFGLRAPERRQVDPEPLELPATLHASLARMARRIRPAPDSVFATPAPEIARLEVTPEGLTTLLQQRPPAWPWALFASVLVQRRNAVQPRLRYCVSGHHPRPGEPVGRGEYARLVGQVLEEIGDLAAKLEGFMLSPGFVGAFGDVDAADRTADAEAITDNAHRLMDYHEKFLDCAERCLRTPVGTESLVFVQDAGAVALCPLAGYEEFIATMCTRVEEMRDLLPYAAGRPIALETATLSMDLPDGLIRRVGEHIENSFP